MTQLNLLSRSDQQSPLPKFPPKNEEALEAINGFEYIENYIDENEQDRLLTQIDRTPWREDLRRRVQHYGFKYDYKARKVNLDMRIGQLPEWLQALGQKLHDDRHMPVEPDQVIINEYQPGQGISSHIDCEPCFANMIVSLSLGSGCVMDFTNRRDKTKKIPVWLAPRSIIVLKDEARYGWLHGIAPRKSDQWEGQTYERQRRVSLTFRKVILDKPVQTNEASLMSTFQGFKITGIDSNKYPVITPDKNVISNQFYLILEPVGEDANANDRILWKHCFRKEFENWQDYEDLKNYQQEEQIEIPPLEFISNDKAYICVSEVSFNRLKRCIPFIEELVKKINPKYIRTIQYIDRVRKEIDQFNPAYFRD